MSKNRPPFNANLFVYHRYLGLVVAVFVLILSVTGIMLNHTESLKLDERSVAQKWLLGVYGISAPQLKKAWQAGDHWISQFGEQVYLDDQPLADLKQQDIKGAQVFNQMVFVATQESLLFYTPSAELIDVLPAPKTLNLGLMNQTRLVIKSERGLFALDENLTQLEPIAGISAAVAYAATQPLPVGIQSAISKQYRGDGLPLERVVLDLHSGRLFGKIGVYVMDGAAVIMILLTITGLTIWIRRIRRKAKRRGDKPESTSAGLFTLETSVGREKDA